MPQIITDALASLASTTGSVLTTVITSYWPYIIGAIALFGIIRVFKRIIAGTSK